MPKNVRVQVESCSLVCPGCDEAILSENGSDRAQSDERRLSAIRQKGLKGGKVDTSGINRNKILKDAVRATNESARAELDKEHERHQQVKVGQEKKDRLKLSTRDIFSTAQNIVNELLPLTDQDREEVMGLVKKDFCPNCWRVLERKEACYCDNDE